MVKETGRPTPFRPTVPGSVSQPPTEPKAKEAAKSANTPAAADLPKHFPKLDGKPSVIQQAAWKGAEALAKRYYGTSGSNAEAGAGSSKVLSFIATAMQSKPDQVLDKTSRELLRASFLRFGLPSGKVDALVESLAEAIAARLGYRPPLSGERMDQVREAVDLLRGSELNALFAKVQQNREEAAEEIARLMDRLLGRVADDEDEDDDEPKRRKSGRGHDGERDDESDSPRDGEDEGEGEVEGENEDLGAGDRRRGNIGARLAALHDVAPEHTPVVYKAVLNFAMTMAEIVGLDEAGR